MQHLHLSLPLVLQIRSLRGQPTYCCLYGVSMDTVCFHGNTLHFAATAAEIGNEHGEEI